MSTASSAVAVRERVTPGAGVVAGTLGAVVMAAFAMIASATYHGVGFLTPLYHIASSVISPEAMMISAAEAQAGTPFSFTLGPAVVGLALHLGVGAAFGAIFGMGVTALRIRGPVLVPLGIAYGALVLVFMAFAGLPITAAVFDGGDPIRNMPAMAGWWTFAIEHLMFGAILGLWLLRSQQRA
jgi:hypothetical protein